MRRKKSLGGIGHSFLPADVALSNLSLFSLKLGPKKGLAIMNGTSMSTGIAVLALHDAHCLLVLSQLLTSVGIEVLRGRNC